MSATGAYARAGLSSFKRQRLLKPVVFVSALTPFLYLLSELLGGHLGPNPIDTLTDQTGTLAIRMLVISLSLTPLRWVLKKMWPVQLRRMLGLFAFFYTSLHVSIYLFLDQQLDLGLIWSDLAERPFIVAGTFAFLLMLPLAVTSSNRIARRMGRRWSALHRFVYIVAAAAVVHYVWLAKGDLIEPLVYLVIMLLLLGYRLTKIMR